MQTITWSFSAVLSMLAFSGMYLTMRHLTKEIDTNLILAFVFISVGISYGLISIFKAESIGSLNLSKGDILFMITCSSFAFLGYMFDIHAIKTAPNPGYAGAIKAGQIVMITTLSYFIFEGIHISKQTVAGITLIIVGILCVSLGAKN